MRHGTLCLMGARIQLDVTAEVLGRAAYPERQGQCIGGIGARVRRGRGPPGRQCRQERQRRKGGFAAPDCGSEQGQRVVNGGSAQGAQSPKRGACALTNST